MSESETPRSIGPYRLEALLGRGGMAEVYRARRDGPGGFVKDLALKRILPRFANDERLVKRFMDEARIAGALIHGNVLQVYDFGEVDGEYFLVMEYVDGTPLVTLLDRCIALGRELPIPLVAFLGAEVGAALGYAHRLTDAEGRPLDVVHRDVSPQNVMLSYSGDVKLADFGIAKAADKLARTEAGLLVGKMSYMSPEQARGDPIDGRTDLFALGIVLWEALTLKPLLPRGDAARALEALDACRFEPPSASRGDVPPELDAIVGKALSREREERHPDGEAMARALRALVHRSYTGYGRHDLAEYLQWVRPDREGKAPRTEPPKLAAPPPAAIGPAAPAAPAPAQPAAPAPAQPAAPRQASRLRWALPSFALAAGLLAGGGVGVGIAPRISGEAAPVAPGQVSGPTPTSPADGDAASGSAPAEVPAAAGTVLTVLTDPAGAHVYVDGLLVGDSPVSEGRPDDRPVTISIILEDTVPLVFPAVVPSAWTAASPTVRLPPADRNQGLVVVRSAQPGASLFQGETPLGVLPQTLIVRWEVDDTVNPQALEVAAPERGRVPLDLSAAQPWELVHVTVGEGEAPRPPVPAP